jgi:hypothetical protein
VSTSVAAFSYEDRAPTDPDAIGPFGAAAISAGGNGDGTGEFAQLSALEVAELNTLEGAELAQLQVAELTPKKRFVIGEFKGLDEGYLNPTGGTYVPTFSGWRIRGNRLQTMGAWATSALSGWTDTTAKVRSYDQSGIVTLGKDSDATWFAVWDANDTINPRVGFSLTSGVDTHIPSFGLLEWGNSFGLLSEGFGNASAYGATGAVSSAFTHTVTVTAPNDNVGEMPDGLQLKVRTFRVARTRLNTLVCYASVDHGTFTINHAGNVKRIVASVTATPSGSPTDVFIRVYATVVGGGTALYPIASQYFLGLITNASGISAERMGPAAKPTLYFPRRSLTGVSTAVEIHQGRLFFTGAYVLNLAPAGTLDALTTQYDYGSPIFYTSPGYLNFSEGVQYLQLQPTQTQGSITNLVSMPGNLLVLCEHGGYSVVGDFTNDVRSYVTEADIGSDSGTTAFEFKGIAYMIYRGNLIAYSNNQVQYVTENQFPNVRFSGASPSLGEGLIYIHPEVAAPLDPESPFAPLYYHAAIFDPKNGQFYAHGLNLGGHPLTGSYVPIIPTRTYPKLWGGSQVFYRSQSLAVANYTIVSDLDKPGIIKEIKRVLVRTKQGLALEMTLNPGSLTAAAVTTTRQDMGDGRFEFKLDSKLSDTVIRLNLGSLTPGTTINPVLEIEYAEAPVMR